MDTLTINGVPISATPDETLNLSCGRVELRRAKGRDWLRALRAARRLRDPNLNLFALLAEIATIDGHPLTIDAMLAMPVLDAMTLQASAAKYFPDREDADSPDNDNPAEQ